MRKHKKLLVIGIVAALAIGTIAFGATALASDSDDDSDTYVSNLAANLGVEEDELEDAMQQALQETREEAREEALAQAVEDGLLTQEEADEIQAWWDARPETLDDPEVRQALRPNKAGDGTGACFRGAHPGPGMMRGGGMVCGGDMDIEKLVDHAVDRCQREIPEDFL